MTIKTYPLQFTAEKLKHIEEMAGKGNIKRFIYLAIEEKLEAVTIQKDDAGKK